MKKNVISVLAVLVILMTVFPATAVTSDVTIDFYTEPENPYSFQPFFAKNQPANVVVEVRDSAGNLVKNVNIKVNIEHVKGIASGKVFNSGFPYLEGKKVLGGEFFTPDGKLKFSYIFPVRGSYKVNLEVSPAEDSSITFEPVHKEFNVRVKEWGFEIRNAVILVLIMLGFGIVLGVIYGRAGLR